MSTAANAATARIILTGSPYVFEFIYADTAAAVQAIARELRDSSMSRRKARNHETLLTNANTLFTWDIHKEGEHVGYATIEFGALDTTRPHVLVQHCSRVLGGAYTDSPTDADDLAIAVAGIVGRYYIANGDRKLNWAEPSKLTDAQQSNPDNASRWQDLRSHVYELITAGRPYVEHSRHQGWTVANYIPDCSYCTDSAIVSAWQNIRDGEETGHGTPAIRDRYNESRIRTEASEYVGQNGQTYDEWQSLTRCTRCAGRNGRADDSAHYAYSRLDETWQCNAPAFVREAAERVALATDPTHRSGAKSPEPFVVCVRNQCTGKFTRHHLMSAQAADEICKTDLSRIAATLTHYNSSDLEVQPKPQADSKYSPGYVLRCLENGHALAYADVHFHAVTAATALGNPAVSIGTLVLDPMTGNPASRS